MMDQRLAVTVVAFTRKLFRMSAARKAKLYPPNELTGMITLVKRMVFLESSCWKLQR